VTKKAPASALEVACVALKCIARHFKRFRKPFLRYRVMKKAPRVTKKAPAAALQAHRPALQTPTLALVSPRTNKKSASGDAFFATRGALSDSGSTSSASGSEKK
jgi:hypothetical protein